MKPTLAFAALALLAAPAAAQDATVRNILGQIAYEAGSLRQSGISQRAAAGMLASKIGGALSDAPGSVHERQYFASLVGSAATPILQVAYSLPVMATGFEREIAAQAVAEVIYGRCLNGEVL